MAGGVARSYRGLSIPLRKPAFLLVPALVVYGSLFVAAVIYFFAMSFWSVKSFRIVPQFTLANYHSVLTVNVKPFLITLAVAFLVGMTATVIGFLYAWIIRFRAGRFGSALLFIALLTLFGGYLMKIYAWKTMLGGNGAINSALISLGIIDSPIESLLYSPLAVVISLSHFLLPFTILSSYASLRGIDDAEIDSARDLGATPWRILLDITIPRARSGLLAGFSLAYLISTGDYLTAQFVGGKMALYGQLIAPQFGTFFNWPLGAAMSFSILATSTMIISLVAFCLSRIGRP